VRELRVVPVEHVPEVVAGDDVGLLIVDAVGPEGLEDGDVVVVTQKVISKAEERILPESQREAALMQESSRVLRRTEGTVIVQTHHGFVCANAGIDVSNVEGDRITLLPIDPDASARRIRSRIKHLCDRDVGVVISDTFGRAWRLGQTDVAIGVAGIEPFLDYRGTTDVQGRELTATRIAVADELAGAAELVMGKADRVCAAIVRGVRVNFGRGSAAEIVRPVSEDLFR
jgi:coenzyme F420-0:L-glutamate ligase / coenzyme F420-1:gamma-L-glutamate ligase